VEPKTLFLLALALGVSGLIAYKTFQWVIYEEISVGVASLFLGFAILVFFSITNYDIIKAWTTPGSYNARNSKEEVKRASSSDLKATHAKESDQNLLDQRVEKLTKEYSTLEEEVNEMTRRAMDEATRAKEQSEKLGLVQLKASWDMLMERYVEIDHYLMRWEEKNALKREIAPVESVAELEEKLEVLAKAVDLPKAIKALYVERQRKYTLLNELKIESEPYAHRLTPMELVLPEPPKLPGESPGLRQSHQEG
jgi:hypothetical protein